MTHFCSWLRWYGKRTNGNPFHFGDIRHKVFILSVEPLGCTTAVVTVVSSLLGEKLDPVFAFPPDGTTIFLFFKRVMMSFGLFQWTVTQVMVEETSLVGDLTFLLFFLIVASTWFCSLSFWFYPYVQNRYSLLSHFKPTPIWWTIRCFCHTLRRHRCQHCYR